jgi:hypothetical protein
MVLKISVSFSLQDAKEKGNVQPGVLAGKVTCKWENNIKMDVEVLLGGGICTGLIWLSTRTIGRLMGPCQ